MGGATDLPADRLQKIHAGCKRKWEAFRALLVTPVRALLSGKERVGDAPAVANAGHGELDSDSEVSEVLAAPDEHGSEIDYATTAKRRCLLHNSAVPTDSADVPIGVRSSKAPVASPEVAGISISTMVASSSAGECHDCTSTNAIGPIGTIFERLTSKISQGSLKFC